MFRLLIAMCAVALLFVDTVKADEGDATRLQPLRGRSGAAKLRTVVVCGVPDAQVEIAPPPREVRASDGKRLRQLAETWSGDLSPVRGKKLEELLEQVPPKYRQMVKDYFDQVEKLSREK